MFCPNCGTKNRSEQNYCRGCGLKLHAIAEAVADQFPSKEYAELLRRQERFERLGVFSLSIAGFIGFALMLFKAAQYKLILFGPEILFGSAVGALIGFLLLSVFFFNYSKFFLKGKAGRPVEDERPSPITSKLIDDRHFEPAGTVTEHTTDFLHTPIRKHEN
jgi:hypothetical protein